MDEPNDEIDPLWDDEMKTLFVNMVRQCSQRHYFSVDQAARDPRLLEDAAVNPNESLDVMRLRRWLKVDAQGFKTRLEQALVKGAEQRDAMAAELEAFVLNEPLDIPEDTEQHFNPEGVISDGDSRYRAAFKPDQHHTPSGLQARDAESSQIRAGQLLAPNGGTRKVLVLNSEGVEHLLEIRFEEWSCLFAVLNTCHRLVSYNHFETVMSYTVPLCDPGPKLDLMKQIFTPQLFVTRLALNSALRLLTDWFVDLERPVDEDVMLIKGTSHTVEEMLTKLGIGSGHVLILCAGCGPRKVRFGILPREDFEEALKNKEFPVQAGVCTKAACGRVAFRIPRLNGNAFFTKAPTPRLSERCPTWKGANLFQIDKAYGYRAELHVGQKKYRCRGALINVGNRIVGVVPGREFYEDEKHWQVVDGDNPEDVDVGEPENLRGEVVAYIYVTG